MSIDIVLLWVDGGDPVWQEEKAKYELMLTGKKTSNACRYREWGTLPYWFRSIEQNAPWTRKIHVVTNGQIPSFLNIDHPKINFVKHSDFMPERYLPTFSSKAIEVNLHRIPDLSEHFIYFNDDMFMNRPMQEGSFFRGGKPCYVFSDRPMKTGNLLNSYQHSRQNGILAVSRHFDKSDLLKAGFFKAFNPRYGKANIKTFINFWRSKNFLGIADEHFPNPFLKSTLSEVWAAEDALLEHTSMQKFRDNESVNQYVFRYWDIARGNFTPWKNEGYRYDVTTQNLAECVRDIETGRHALLCLNDSELCDDFDAVSKAVTEAFERRYPKKSSFEK